MIPDTAWVTIQDRQKMYYRKITIVIRTINMISETQSYYKNKDLQQYGIVCFFYQDTLCKFLQATSSVLDTVNIYHFLHHVRK